MTDTAIIIVNWNGEKYIEKCIQLTLNQTHSDFRIYLLDNASSDNSIKIIKSEFLKEIKSKKINIILSQKNTGFAEGNNIAIREILKDKNIENIVLLNNDAYPDKNWLKELIIAKKKNKTAEMISCKTLFEKNNQIDTLGIKINFLGLGSDIKNAIDINKLFCPSGVAALYSRTLLEDIAQKNNYFDSDFFCYYEDVDLGIRARTKGYQTAYAKKAIVNHVHSGSTTSEFPLYHGHRNSLWVVAKNFSTKKIIILSPLLLLAHIYAVLKYTLRGKGKIVLNAKIDALKKWNYFRKKQYLII
jgi:GT2 family glycosyltransferase